MEMVEGNPASGIRVVIYEDLQCGDCLAFRTLLDDKLLPRYGSKVAFVHRDFPLGKHDWARFAAIAGRWVYERNHELGITFRREIMSEHDHLTAESLKSWVREFARRNNMSQDGIEASLSDPRLTAAVEQDLQGGIGRGVRKTPTVWIGNQTFIETILYEDIAQALDLELGIGSSTGRAR